jgi:hypothetical protein
MLSANFLTVKRNRILAIALLMVPVLMALLSPAAALANHSAAATVGAAYDAHQRGDIGSDEFTLALRAATAVAKAAHSLLPEAGAHSTWVCYETGWFYDDAAHPDAWVNIDVIGSGPNGSIVVRHHHLWVDGREDFSYHTCYT